MFVENQRSRPELLGFQCRHEKMSKDLPTDIEHFCHELTSKFTMKKL